MQPAPHSPHRINRGFTLLELLVVLVLMGIILGMATLAVGDGGRAERIRHEARQMTARLNLIADEAVLNSRPYGVQLSSDGYRFLSFHEGEWSASGEGLLHPHKLVSGIELALYIDGAPVHMNERAAHGTEGDQRPHLVFYSSAEHTAFEIELRYTDTPQLPYRLSASSVDRVAWQAVENGAT